MDDDAIFSDGEADADLSRSAELETLRFLGEGPDQTGRILSEADLAARGLPPEQGIVERVLKNNEARITPLSTSSGTSSSPLDRLLAEPVGEVPNANTAILERYAKVVEFFKGKPISPVDDPEFQKGVVARLVEINLAFVCGSTGTTVDDVLPSADSLTRAGVASFLANNPAARFAVGQGLDLGTDI